MKSENKIQWKLLTIVSLICLLVPLSVYLLWIYVFDLGTTQAERVAIFKDYFPDFLDGRWTVTIISFALSLSAVILSAIGLGRLKKLWKLMNTVILIAATILLLLNLFSMM